MMRASRMYCLVIHFLIADGLRQSIHSDTSTDRAFELSHKFLEAARILPEDSPTMKMLTSFRICGSCSTFQRLGEMHDGGYLTCMDGAEDTTGVLSVGVEQHDQWSEHIAAALNVRVNQFDCTVDKGSNCGGLCSFHRQCLISNDDHEKSSMSPHVNLTEAIRMAGYSELADRSLIMKMDCEGCEWPIFEVESQEMLNKFKQIILEFHGLRDETKHEIYATALQNLLQSGFQVAHLHGNNWDSTYSPYQDPRLVIPNVLEVTFVTGSPTSGCLKVQDYRKLDAVNRRGFPELPYAKLP